jgi:hypothetical protein
MRFDGWSYRRVPFLRQLDDRLSCLFALRLLLGSDAYAAAEKNDLARLEEARIWKQLSVSTDFETK